MSRMAHMELIIQKNMNVNLGDVIMYVNNGKKVSQGDVQKMTPKQIREVNEYNKNNNVKTSEIIEGVIVNCYMLDQNILETNPNLTGEYNVPRAIATFNKKIQPLLVVFKQEVRDELIVDNPVDRGIFTKEQCELINGIPFEETDQDKIEDVLTMSEGEIKFWGKKGIDANYIYELAEKGWEEFI